MPRLFILCEYPTLSGGERSMLATLEHVRRADFSPAVIAPAAGPLADAVRQHDLEVLPFRTHSSAGKRRSQANLRAELKRLLTQHRPDLVHANSLSMGRLLGPVADQLAVPSIGHMRDIIRLSAQAVADLNRNTRILVVSRSARDFHIAGGVDAGRTYVLHNGVDLDRFRPRRSTGYLHRELGLPPGAILVGTIGQIGPRKGTDVFARAAIGLMPKHPDIHYLVVGQRWSDKPESRRFESDLRALAGDRLAGRIHFLGYRDDVPQILNELALLVHAARQEPLGRVLLEAAATGAAIVATDVGGTDEIFPPGTRAAMLVPQDDPAATAGAINQLLGDPPLCQAMGARARQQAQAAFNARHAAEKLTDHYRAVMSEKAS